MEYKPTWDLTTIPDRDLAHEWNRRAHERRGGINPGGEARKVLRPCEICGVPYAAREMRKHLPDCKKKHPKEALKLKRMKGQ